MTTLSETPIDDVLEDAKRLLAEVTPVPWWIEESDDAWVLQGVATRIMVPGYSEQIVNHQILKATKHGTDYAEYWPNAAAGALIARAPEVIAALAAELEDARMKLASLARTTQ